MFIYPDTNSAWTTAYANKDTSFEANGAMNLDARVLFYFNATGVTQAMAATHAGLAPIMPSRIWMPARSHLTAQRSTSCTCRLMFR